MNKLYFLLVSIFLASGFVFGANSDYAYILKVDSLSTYPTQIYPNSVVSLNVILSNISEISDATNVRIELGSDDRYFTSIKSSDNISIIKFKQSATTSLRVKVNEDVSGGYYVLPIKITYMKGNISTTINDQVTIGVEEYRKLDLTISEYPKTKTYLDDKINVKGNVKNVGNVTLKGISVNAEYSANSLAPSSPTSLFLGDIEPGNNKEFSFELVVPRSSTIGTYDLSIVATDIDSAKDTEKLTYIVEDKPTLIISSIEKSLLAGATSLKQGMDFSLSIQVENISKSNAKAIVMKIHENETIEGTMTTYVGSLESDDSGSGVFDLKVKDDAKLGENLILVDIEYIDMYDNNYTLTKEVSLFVNKKDSSYSGIFLVIFIGALGYGIYYYMSRKKLEQSVRNLRG